MDSWCSGNPRPLDGLLPHASLHVRWCHGFVLQRHQDDGRPVPALLQDIYYAENQIIKALPDMIEKATNRELSAAFKSHLAETEQQVKRLDQAFALIGHEPKGTKCPAINGIIDEANEVAGEVDDKKVLDAALLAAAQAVEHYEITRYGTLIAWAEELGKEAVAKLLTTNLNEEKAADKKLTTIAEKKVNLKAAG
jgi:ferritin-like metal-binding protein YciE